MKCRVFIYLYIFFIYYKRSYEVYEEAKNLEEMFVDMTEIEDDINAKKKEIEHEEHQKTYIKTHLTATIIK